MSLDAFFIGVIQVLVYAGAVMVLFLFIIMLLDLRAEERRKINLRRLRRRRRWSRCVFVAQLYLVVGQLARRPSSRFPPLPAADACDDVRKVGTASFHNYNLPFQIIGVLVLVATIGVIVLSKRELR